MLNHVSLSGFVARSPRRFGQDYAFPLAVYRDPDRPANVVAAETSPDAGGRAGDKQGKKNGQKRDVPDFPPVVVVAADLPPFVRHRALVRVEGWLRTRNRTESLRNDVRRALRKAGMDDEAGKRITTQIPDDLVTRKVEIEVVATRIVREQGGKKR